MSFDANFWAGKRVLITGHTGFKGAWLASWLLNLQADVIGFSLRPTAENVLFASLGLDSQMCSIAGDIRNKSQLQDLIVQHQPEIIFHLAAQSLVRYSYQHPQETYDTNVMGTLNLLEAMRQPTQIKRALVNVTTDKCYQNQDQRRAFVETDPLGGRDPYSSSKACSEMLTLTYRDSYFHPDHYSEHGLAIATARAGNVIGGGDWAQERIIPDLIRAFEQGAPVVLRNPQAIRPWQFVLEPLAGYLVLAQKLWQEGPAWNGPWNFGPEAESLQTVAWLTNYLQARWPDAKEWVSDQQINPYEAAYLSLNCSKAKTKLNWQPRLTLKTTLDWLSEWYLASSKGQNMQTLTRQQIQDYQERL